MLPGIMNYAEMILTLGLIYSLIPVLKCNLGVSTTKYFLKSGISYKA